MDTIRPWLYIGNYRDTIVYSSLHAAQINVLLTFAEPVTHPDISCHYLAVEDGISLDQEILSNGIARLQDAYTNNQRVLVACGAGISRSATFAIAILKEVEQLSLLEAARVVHRIRPSIAPHYALWLSLCTYYDEDIPYLTLIRELPSQH